MNSVPEDGAKAPNCWRCTHFGMSWDARARYACRLHGFKSPRLPSLEVLQADGRGCMGFKDKGQGQ